MNIEQSVQVSDTTVADSSITVKYKVPQKKVVA